MSAVIELGELSRHDEPPGRDQLSARMRRGLLAASVAVMCLLGAAGSARANPGLEGPLWTGDVSLLGFGLGTESVYLAEPNGKVVFARDLWTGNPRWRFETDELPLFTVDAGAGIAAVVTRRTSQRVEGPVDSSVALIKEATGAVLTRTTGEQHTTTAGTLLLTRTRPGCPLEPYACVDMAAVNLATGADVWRVSLSPGAYFILSFDDNRRVDGFAEIRDREIAIRDIATGAVIDRMGNVTCPHPCEMFGDMLVTASREQVGVVVTAYRRGPLARAWSLALPVSPGPTDLDRNELNGIPVLESCGELLCLYADSGEFLIDAKTGVLRTARVNQLVTGRLGRFLIARSPPERPPTVYLLDSAGNTVATFGDSELVDWQDSGDRALLAHRGPDRMAFSILDPDGHKRTLGSVAGADLACQAQGRALACSDPVGQLRVWRLPRS